MNSHSFDELARQLGAARSRREVLKVLWAAAAGAVLAPLLAPLGAARAQAQGATMTVLRGQVAVLRPDGSALQPAPSGATVSPGDEIRTLNQTDALITFFSGIEIELGEDTILVVERVSRQGDRVDVSLRQVLGTSLNRIATFADPGSTYQIQAGGAVALVRGTRFLLGVTAAGVVVLVVLEGRVVINPGTPGETTVGAGQTAYFTFEFVDGVPRQTGRVVVTRSSPDPTGGGYNELHETIAFVEHEVLGGDANLTAAELAEIAGAADEDEDEDDDPCRGVRCPDGRTCCNGTCRDLRTDRDHCGRCGRACSNGQTCSNGSCVRQTTTATCGRENCSGCCENSTCRPGTSTAACGRNGATCVACASGQTCVNGACVSACNATTCPNGCCDGGICVPFASQTTTRCGRNGSRCAGCAAGEICVEGVCVSGPNPTCAGATCGNFRPCSTNPDCVCTTTSTGGGFCVPGSTSCQGLVRCPTGTECPAGQLCVVNTCCRDAVCVPTSLECPPDAPATTRASTGRRSTRGPTIARR